MRETYCQVVARLLEQNPPQRQTMARAIRAQFVARVRTIAFLVVTGTSILSIWDIQVTSLAFVLRKLHPRNLLALTSTLRFEYSFLAVV